MEEREFCEQEFELVILLTEDVTLLQEGGEDLDPPLWFVDGLVGLLGHVTQHDCRHRNGLDLHGRLKESIHHRTHSLLQVLLIQVGECQ